jgi:hypothetical protein
MAGEGLDGVQLKDILADVSEFIVKYSDFTISTEIGQGACGKIFIATHRMTGKKVALKQLSFNELIGVQQSIGIPRMVQDLVAFMFTKTRSDSRSDGRFAL